MINIDLYAWAQGRQRKATIKALTHPMTPTQTHKEAKQYNERMSLNNTSDTLRSFVRKGLAECLNPQVKTGRLYQLTQEGEEIREELMKG